MIPQVQSLLERFRGIIEQLELFLQSKKMLQGGREILRTDNVEYLVMLVSTSHRDAISVGQPQIFKRWNFLSTIDEDALEQIAFNDRGNGEGRIEVRSIATIFLEEFSCQEMHGKFGHSGESRTISKTQVIKSALRS